MAIPDVTGVTFGFFVPASAHDRRSRLVMLQLSRFWRRLQPLARIGGAVIIFLVAALWRWEPSLSRCGTGVLLAFVWLAVLWSLDRRYRLGALEVTEALVKRGLSGTVIARQIVAKARPMLATLPLEPVPVPIDFTPPISAEIAGTKLSFTQVGELVRMLRGTFSNSIQTELTAETEGFSIRFTIERESRTSAPVRLGAGLEEADFVAAARALVRFAAPFHAGCILYLAGNIEAAGALAHGAARHGRCPADMRAACWRLMALMRAELGDLKGVARALHMAASGDPANAITFAMIADLLGAKASLTHDVAVLGDVRAAQRWYQSLRDNRRAPAGITTRFNLALLNAVTQNGRVRGIALTETRLDDVRSKFEEALLGKWPPHLSEWQADHSVEVFAEVIGNLQTRFQPGPDQSGEFLEAYNRVCEKASGFAALIRRSTEEMAALRAASQNWKRAVEEEKKHAKEAYPEDYERWVEDERREGEDLNAAEQRYVEGKRLGVMVNETLDWLRQQQTSMREKAARKEALQAAWDAMEATPFET